MNEDAARMLVDHGKRISALETIEISGAAGGGSAPDNAQYVVMALNAILTAERVLTAGDSISLADGGAGGNATIALTIPGTLTVATANNAVGPHLHTITSSSNPGAAASILASDANGYLQLVGLGIGAAPGSADLHFATGRGITHVDGIAAGQFLRANGVRYVPDTLDVADITDLAYAAPNLTLGLANAVGAANTVIRTDATILAFDAVVPDVIQCDDAAAAGAAAVTARRDHTHGIVCAAPGANLTVATANAEGVATSFARSDHSHAITSSSNPGAAASILASDASGYLQLVGLGIGTAATAANSITMVDGAWIGIGGAVERIIFDAAGDISILGANFVVGGSAPSTNMTSGITIQQGAADDEILALQSSDVAHGGTDLADSDTFGLAQKSEGNSGGLHLIGLKSVSGDNSRAAMITGYLAENVDTGKTAAGRSVIEIQAAQISGTGAADIVANGNILGVRARKAGAFTNVFLLDEDGDLVLWGNLTLDTDGSWVGNGAAAPRIVFDAGNAGRIELEAVVGVDIGIGGVDDFTFTANAFNVLTGSSIVMADGTTIGQAAGPLLTFDDTLNYLEITGCNVGIGTATPSSLLHVNTASTANDVVLAKFWSALDGDGEFNSIRIGRADAGGQEAIFGYRYDTTPGDEGAFITMFGDPISSFYVRKGGNVGLGTLTPGSITEWNMANEDLEFVDAHVAVSVATVEAVVEVITPTGGTGYVAVYSSYGT